MLMRATCILAFGVWLAGCATLQHSLSVGEYAGRTLSTRGGDGATRLEAELEVDATLRDYVAANGRPDYLHVVDRMGLYFFYVADDRAVKFERDFLPPSVARDLGRIPGTLLKMLPKREVDAIVARRSAAKRRDASRQTRPRRARPAPVPAAPARSGGYLSRSFDVKTIIARLRPPLTAADPGVSGWRKVQFSDGVMGSTAARGSHRYEVRRDRLVLAIAMPAARVALPGWRPAGSMSWRKCPMRPISARLRRGAPSA